MSAYLSDYLMTKFIWKLTRYCEKALGVKCDRTEKIIGTIGIITFILFLIAFFLFAM